MANNIDGHQAYLIYGADDNGNVKGIENTTYRRYTTKSVTEFLRSKPFAGGYVPKVAVQTIKIEGHELDIAIIKITNNTPYYLTEEYSQSHDAKKKLYAGAIYTRINDVNVRTMHGLSSRRLCIAGSRPASTVVLPAYQELKWKCP